MKTISLTAKVRTQEEAPDALRKAEKIPAVVYGHNVPNVSIAVEYKDFIKAYRAAGESSLIELAVDGEKEKRLVLVHEVQKDAISDKVTHLDFLQPSLKEEVEVEVPLVVEGEAPAVKDLGGTLIKNISELGVKALPQKLPHEIVVNIEVLKTFEDHILAKDIKLPEGVSLTINPDEIVMSVLAQQDVEAELAKEIVEEVENVEKVEKEEKTEEVVEETPEEKKPAEPAK